MHLPPMNKKIAIYPGAFDPITLGHCDIIRRASRTFEHLIVAVAYDARKSIMFSVEDRMTMLQGEIDSMHLTNVEATSFKGLLVDFVASKGAVVIVRGLRAVSDFEYEFKMAYINRKLNSNIDTILMPATEDGHFISSSLVKEIAKLKGSLDGLVSQKVAKIVQDRVAELKM